MLTLDMANLSALDQGWFEVAPAPRRAQWRIYTQSHTSTTFSTAQPVYVRSGAAVLPSHIDAVIGAPSRSENCSEYVLGLQELTARLQSGVAYNGAPELTASADRALAASTGKHQSVRQWAKSLAESVFIR